MIYHSSTFFLWEKKESKIYCLIFNHIWVLPSFFVHKLKFVYSSQESVSTDHFVWKIRLQGVVSYACIHEVQFDILSSSQKQHTFMVSSVTKSVEQSPSWDAGSCSASKIYCHIHKSLSLDTILIQTNLDHTQYLDPFQLSSSLHLGLTVGYWEFCSKILLLLFRKCKYCDKCMCNFYRWTVSSSVLYTTQLVSHLELWYPCDFRRIWKVTPVKNVEL